MIVLYHQFSEFTLLHRIASNKMQSVGFAKEQWQDTKLHNMISKYATMCEEANRVKHVYEKLLKEYKTMIAEYERKYGSLMILEETKMIEAKQDEMNCESDDLISSNSKITAIESEIDEIKDIFCVFESISNAENNLKKHSEKLIEMILRNYMGWSDQRTKMMHEMYIRDRVKLWINAPHCFAKMLLYYDFKHCFFVDPSVNEIIYGSKFNEAKNEFKLVQDENGNICLKDDYTGFISSPCFALHISSGSYYFNKNENLAGYRHINFLTQCGTVYWGCGIEMDKKSLELLNKLYIMRKDL